MRPTRNASAASCKHIMVLPWKHISVLPTAWAIPQTRHEKGSFLMRSSVLIWNYQISQRATVPGWYFLVFFTFPALRNSFQGALPPMVGWSFLAAGSSPKTDSLASTAIWANCWVGNNDGNLPTSSSCLASSTCLSASSIIFSTSLVGEGFLAGEGWCTGEGAPLSLPPSPSSPSWQFRPYLLWIITLFSPPSPFFGVTFVLAILFQK